MATPVVQATTLATYGHPGTIAPEYFGLHIYHTDTGTPWPPLSFGSWRLWDTKVAWPNLQPAQGTWHFQTLDQDVALARNHGLNDLMLTLVFSPQWASARPGETCANYNLPGCAAPPADINTWRTYVRTVAQRYKGLIKNYEIWNEPNLPGSFSGDLNAMVSLACAAYQEIKAVDPNAKVVSPPATTYNAGAQWLDGFLQSGGGKCMDVVAYHFYTLFDPPEAVIGEIDAVGAVMQKYGIAGKPLWNTEAGWAIANAKVPLPSWVPSDWPVLSDETASAYVVRALVLAAWKGVARYYWYSWDDNGMALIEPDTNQPKRAGLAYGVANTWLKGTTVSSCTQTNNWICELKVPGGGVRHIIWSAGGTQSFTVPSAWQANTAKTVSGPDINLAATAGVVQISPSPILVY